MVAVPKALVLEHEEKFANVSKRKNNSKVLEITFKYKHHIAQPEKIVSFRISSSFPKKNSKLLAHSGVK